MKTIKRLLLIIAVLFLIAQSISSQYSLMVKGQACPFDTAVATQVKQYRLESKKFTECDSIKHFADSIVAISKAANRVSNIVILGSSERKIIADSLQQISNRRYTDLNNQFVDYKKEVEKQNTWIRRNEKYLWFVGGILITATPIYLLRKQ